MSFLKISDPAKRDLMVKDYLELKKNIRDNLLSERTREQQLQTDLSKFFKPITETQKATTKEITEEFKPTKEGIENLPPAITFPAYPSIQAFEEPLEGQDTQYIGKVAEKHLRKLATKGEADKTYGLYDRYGNFYIGEKPVVIIDNNIVVEDEEYEVTPCLWELIISKEPKNFTEQDHENYARLMIKTNALRQKKYPNRPRSSKGYKWNNTLKKIWDNRKEYEGSGVIVIPSDPNTLLERLDLLLASQEAGHTGVRNELVSICDELKRQGVLNSNTYKKLISNIKNDVPKHGFKKRYAYGGSGIFDTIANLLTRIFTGSAAKQIASSALDVGKSVAKEGAKKALEAGKSAAVDVGKKLVTKALTPKSKKILQKYTESTPQPTTQDINTLIDCSAVEIQDLVKKLNRGAGIKVV